MLFGLKNTEVTYQRAMIAIFKEMLEDIVECYVNHLVVNRGQLYGTFKDGSR